MSTATTGLATIATRRILHQAPSPIGSVWNSSYGRELPGPGRNNAA
ncbi:MAG TPA: hypothetical protein VFJ83_15825 [Nocardioidaceae bacterium]|nr:hypothetical protein [Nocardioidaceae bacterium]